MINKIKIKYIDNKIVFTIDKTDIYINILDPSEEQILFLYDETIKKVKRDIENKEILNILIQKISEESFDWKFISDCDFIDEEKVSSDERISSDIINKYLVETLFIYKEEVKKANK